MRHRWASCSCGKVGVAVVISVMFQSCDSDGTIGESAPWDTTAPATEAPTHTGAAGDDERIIVEESSPHIQVLVRAQAATGDGKPAGAVAGRVVTVGGCLALQMDGGENPLPFLLPMGSEMEDEGAVLPDGSRLTVGEHVHVGGMVFPSDELSATVPGCDSHAYAYVFDADSTG